MFILDDDANFFSNRKIKERVSILSFIFLEVYLNPVFPPKIFKILEKTKELEYKIYITCKNRKIPDVNTLAEKVFFKELKKADERVINYYKTSMDYFKSIKNAYSLFLSNIRQTN